MTNTRRNSSSIGVSGKDDGWVLASRKAERHSVCTTVPSRSPRFKHRRYVSDSLSRTGNPVGERFVANQASISLTPISAPP